MEQKNYAEVLKEDEEEEEGEEEEEQSNNDVLIILGLIALLMGFMRFTS